MNWNYLIDMGLIMLFLLGIFLAKTPVFWTWSLKRRAHLRNEVKTGLKLCRDLRGPWGSSKRRSPIEFLYKMFKNYQQQKMDREIFESLTFLRNLASIEKGKTSSTDSIIERLSEHNGMLQPIFIKMLNLLRINQPKEAAELFTKMVGTSASRDFAGLLIQWDKLDPSELTEMLLSYEKSLKAIRLTDQKRKDEVISDLIYLPVVINILIIFINFIYVAYFIDQREMLQMFM